MLVEHDPILIWGWGDLLRHIMFRKQSYSMIIKLKYKGIKINRRANININGRNPHPFLNSAYLNIVFQIRTFAFWQPLNCLSTNWIRYDFPYVGISAMIFFIALIH